MLMIPDHVIRFYAVRPEGHERYRSLKLGVDIYNSDGKIDISGIIPFETIDELHIQLNELYNSGTSIRYCLPMTNAMHRYIIYGGKINYEIYHIFLVRDDSRTGAEEVILDTKMDGFELSFFLYEMGKELMEINDGNIDIL